jgi:hypothetical protein
MASILSYPIEGPDRSVSKPSLFFVFADSLGSGSKIYRSKDIKSIGSIMIMLTHT